MDHIDYPAPYCEIPKKQDGDENGYRGTRLCDVLTDKVIKVYNNLDFYVNNVPVNPNDITSETTGVVVKQKGFADYWKHSRDPAGIACDFCDAFTSCSQGMSRQETQIAVNVASTAGMAAGGAPGAAVQAAITAVEFGCMLGNFSCFSCDVRFNNSMVVPAASVKSENVPQPTVSDDPIINIINPPPKKQNYDLGLDAIITGFRFGIQRGVGISRLIAVVYCPVLQADNLDPLDPDGKYHYYRADADIDEKFFQVDGVKIRRSFKLNNKDDEILGNNNSGGFFVDIKPYITYPAKAYGLRGVAFNINNRGINNVTEIYFLFTSFWDEDSIVYRINKDPGYIQQLPENSFPSSGGYIVYINGAAFTGGYDLASTNKWMYIRDLTVVGADYNQDGGIKGFYGASFVDLRSVRDTVFKTSEDVHACCTLSSKDAYTSASLEYLYCMRNDYKMSYNTIEPSMSSNCLADWKGYCTQERFDDNKDSNQCRKFCTYGYTDCDKLINNHCSKIIRKVPYITLTSPNNVLSIMIFKNNEKTYKNYDITVTPEEISLFKLVDRINKEVINQINHDTTKSPSTPVVQFSLSGDEYIGYNISALTNNDEPKASVDNIKSDEYYFNIQSTPLSNFLGFKRYNNQPQTFIGATTNIENVTYKELKIDYIEVTPSSNTLILNILKDKVPSQITITIDPGLYKINTILSMLGDKLTSQNVYHNINLNDGKYTIDSDSKFKFTRTPLSDKLGFGDTYENFTDPNNKITLTNNPQLVVSIPKQIMDYTQLDKDPICKCYLGGEPVKNLDSINKLPINERPYALPFDSLRLYLSKVLNMQKTEQSTTPVECILPKCRSSQYKYKAYKDKLNSGTFICDNQLECISNNGLLSYNFKMDNNGMANIPCKYEDRDMTTLDDTSYIPKCTSPYVPNIVIAPKADSNCLQYIKPIDKDCEIETSFSATGTCGSEQPSKQKYEKRIRRFPQGNGKWCPPARDRVKYEYCVEETKYSISAVVNTSTTKLYLIILFLIVCIGIFFFYKKIVFS